MNLDIEPRVKRRGLIGSLTAIVVLAACSPADLLPPTPTAAPDLGLKPPTPKPSAIRANTFTPTAEPIVPATPTRFEARPTQVPTSAPQTPTSIREIPTAIIINNTPVPPSFEVTAFSFQPISATEIGIYFCTKGRPVGTTLRLMVYEDPIPNNAKVDPNTLDEKRWQSLPINGELGVPCFNTNPSSRDWPIWRIKSLESGTYLFRGEARPAEAKGEWKDPSVLREYRQYILTKP